MLEFYKIKIRARRRCVCVYATDTAQKMKFCIDDFFSKCDQIHNFFRIWSNLLTKSLMENFIFVKLEVRI